ncbi:MAG: hypothetical protein II942_03285 [Alphaproteobacteria bacterium]|nr:hypothetical protein [Alphaproteobacteria bacterium]
MKLKTRTLKHLCKRYGVRGDNADDIVGRFLSQYPETELTCTDWRFTPHEWTKITVSRLSFYAVHKREDGTQEESSNPVLDFYPEVHNSDVGHIRPNVTLRDADGDTTHVYYGSNEQYHYSKEESFQKAQAAARLSREKATAAQKPSFLHRLHSTLLGR